MAVGYSTVVVILSPSGRNILTEEDVLGKVVNKLSPEDVIR